VGQDLNGYPAKYLKKDCNPLLVLHPKKDSVQKYQSVKPNTSRAKKML